jgi:hypothetical protein
MVGQLPQLDIMYEGKDADADADVDAVAVATTQLREHFHDNQNPDPQNPAFRSLELLGHVSSNQRCVFCPIPPAAAAPMRAVQVVGGAKHGNQPACPGIRVTGDG